MISSESEYIEAMREMVRKVQHGYEPPFSASAEEMEILSDCIKSGYIRGRTSYIDQRGQEQELRALDGKMHPEITNFVIPPKGLAFINASTPSPTEHNKRRKPRNTHSDQENNDLGKKSLHWTIAGVIVAAVIGILTILVTIVIWRLSQPRP